MKKRYEDLVFKFRLALSVEGLILKEDKLSFLVYYLYMNMRIGLTCLFSLLLLTGCDINGSIEEETPNIKEEMSCQDRPHVSFFLEYRDERKPQSAFNEEGYMRIKPTSYTGYAHHTKKVVEQYEISDLGIRFHVKQTHSECIEETRGGYGPLVYNKELQSIIFVSPSLQFSIKKIPTVPKEMKLIVGYSDLDRGISSIGYAESGAVVKTTEGDIFMMGRSGAGIDDVDGSRAIAYRLFDKSEEVTNPFIPRSLEFTHQKK